MDSNDFQQWVIKWGNQCFGTETFARPEERTYRFLEEALELVQAAGCTEADAIKLVQYVYSRPVGDQRQEVGGVLVTLAGLCQALGITMMDAGYAEIARIWHKLVSIREKHATRPLDSPLPQAVAPCNSQRAAARCAWQGLSLLSRSGARPWNNARLRRSGTCSGS